jgi:hypothetical protein
LATDLTLLSCLVIVFSSCGADVFNLIFLSNTWLPCGTSTIFVVELPLLGSLNSTLK